MSLFYKSSLMPLRHSSRHRKSLTRCVFVVLSYAMKTQLKATKTLSLCHKRAGVSNIWISDLKWTSLAASQWGEVFTWNLISSSLQRERQARLHIVTIPVNHYSNFRTFLVRRVIFHCFDYLKLPCCINLLLLKITKISLALGLAFVWYLNFSPEKYNIQIW